MIHGVCSMCSETFCDDEKVRAALHATETGHAVEVFDGRELLDVVVGELVQTPEMNRRMRGEVA
jgi:hypothetical protein